MQLQNFLLNQGHTVQSVFTPHLVKERDLFFALNCEEMTAFLLSFFFF